MADLMTTLRERFPASDPRISDLEAKFKLVDSFRPVIPAWKKEAASNRNLSADGAAAAYRKKIGENVMREIRDMNKMIADSKARLEASRIKVTQPEYDKSDLLAASYRREIREFLRSASTEQRLSLVMDEKSDPLFLHAALELPPMLSGIPETQAVHIRRLYAERFHPDVLEHIDLRDDALGVMTAFASVVKEEVKKEAGLEGKAFEAWYETGAEPEAA